MAQQPKAVFVQHPSENWGLVIKPPRSGSDADLTAHEMMILALREQVERLQAERGQVTKLPGSWQCGNCGVPVPAPSAPPAAPYKDSTPDLHVGESSFEGWCGSYLLIAPVHQAKKQYARGAYAAGMGDPLVSRASPPADQASAELRQAAQALVDRWDMPCWKGVQHTGEFINRLREALAAQPKPLTPEVDADCRQTVIWSLMASKSWLKAYAEAYVDDWLSGRGAVPVMVPLTDKQIDAATRHIYNNGRPTAKEYRVGIARAIERSHGITPGDGSAK